MDQEVMNAVNLLEEAGYIVKIGQMYGETKERFITIRKIGQGNTPGTGEVRPLSQEIRDPLRGGIPEPDILSV